MVPSESEELLVPSDCKFLIAPLLLRELPNLEPLKIFKNYRIKGLEEDDENVTLWSPDFHKCGNFGRVI